VNAIGRVLLPELTHGTTTAARPLADRIVEEDVHAATRDVCATALVAAVDVRRLPAQGLHGMTSQLARPVFVATSASRLPLRGAHDNLAGLGLPNREAVSVRALLQLDFLGRTSQDDLNLFATRRAFNFDDLHFVAHAPPVLEQ
jgi:hypothetical protein